MSQIYIVHDANIWIYFYIASDIFKNILGG